MIATVFGVGYAPVMPGTFGSAIGAAIAWCGSGTVFCAALALSTVAGLAVCAPSRRALHADDPSPFVMDEVAGMLVSLVGVPHSWKAYLAAFVLFRALDTLKPWPISRIQASRNPLSIMGDDLLAGVFTAVAVQIGLRFF